MIVEYNRKFSFLKSNFSGPVISDFQDTSGKDFPEFLPESEERKDPDSNCYGCSVVNAHHRWILHSLSNGQLDCSSPPLSQDRNKTGNNKKCIGDNQCKGPCVDLFRNFWDMRMDGRNYCVAGKGGAYLTLQNGNRWPATVATLLYSSRSCVSDVFFERNFFFLLRQWPYLFASIYIINLNIFYSFLKKYTFTGFKIKKG